MPALDHCDVYFSDGRTLSDTTVLFKDNGWIRTGTNDTGYQYYPPHAVDAVHRDTEQ